MSGCEISSLLRTRFGERSFDILLEDAERLGAFDQLGLCFTAGSLIGQDKRRRAGDACCRAVSQILLDAILVFAAIQAAVELIGVQSIDFRGDRLETLVGKGTDTLALDVGKQHGMHVPELVLLAGTVGSRGCIR